MAMKDEPHSTDRNVSRVNSTGPEWRMAGWVEAVLGMLDRLGLVFCFYRVARPMVRSGHAQAMQDSAQLLGDIASLLRAQEAADAQLLAMRAEVKRAFI